MFYAILFPASPFRTALSICATRSSPLPARNTQVSLLPPPCEEFTTSDPFRSATRVSPPGTNVIFSPIRMYGRRSICRDSTPPSIKQGAHESDNVGCAI